MAYGDRKQSHSRGTSWTKEDQRRSDARERKEARLRAKQLNGLSPNGLKIFLANEAAAEQKIKAEQQAQHQIFEQKETARKELIVDQTRLAAGWLHSEVAAAIARKERYNLLEGDWLDDPVEGLITGKAFAEEYNRPYGVKMMVNLCLDCSNSMKHNHIDQVGAIAVQQMYLMLAQVAKDLPDGVLLVNVYGWACGEDGKVVRQRVDAANERNIVNDAGRLSDWWFDGEDTYIETLLRQINRWEEDHDGQSYHRIDIIVTDGVLEHPKDKRLADDIQERRNGSLQTVMFNFLPMEEWGDFAVPKRCVQYEADANNLLPLMRQTFGEWVSAI